MLMKGNKYSDLKIGQKASITKKITEKNLVDLAVFISTFVDQPDNKEKEKIFIAGKDKFAHNMMLASCISSVLGTKLPGPGYISLGQDFISLGQNLKPFKEFKPNEIVKAEVVVTKKFEDKKFVALRTSCYNQKNEMLIDGRTLMLASPFLL